MLKTVEIIVRGKVQGVFFRASTKQKADELGVKGFVLNQADGSVYIQAEAEETILNAFLEWCKQGPSRARVDQCQIQEMPIKNFATFEVRRD